MLKKILKEIMPDVDLTYSNESLDLKQMSITKSYLQAMQMNPLNQYMPAETETAADIQAVLQYHFDLETSHLREQVT